MDINSLIIMKNLGAFTSAYGLASNAEKLVEDILNRNGHIESVGILLRDPVTKKGLISCHFPAVSDVTNAMVWVPADERPLEAVPIYTREISTEVRPKTFHNRFEDKMNSGNFFLIEEGDFRLRVHHSFSKHGVIKSYISEKGYGFIRRNRRGIFFMQKWCNLREINEGEEVSFIPIISHRGLQARSIEAVAA